MFWKILSLIYIFSIILESMSFYLITHKALAVWKKKYPEIALKGSDHWTDGVNALMSIGFLLICPVINTILAIMYLFYFDYIVKSIIEKWENKYITSTKEGE